MEPITHALTSLALARAARARLPRYGTAMLILSGVAPDFDFISCLAGPAAFLKFHRAVLHSILGSVAMCLFIATIFFWMDRARAKRHNDTVPLAFCSALLVCAAGASAHIVLDVASGIGVRLWWPLRGGWWSWDLLANLDIWILILLAAGLLLPHLVRLVNEEIGERKRGGPGRIAATLTLVLLVTYVGARQMLHSRALDLLRSRDYHGQPPQKTGAFADSSNPFAWRGLVSTPDAIDEIDLSLLAGATFDPERAVPHYKPDDSPAIVAAQDTSDAKLFLAYARFPFATMEPQGTGFNVTLRDLRFPARDGSLDNIVVDVRLDANSRAGEKRTRYATSPRR